MNCCCCTIRRHCSHCHYITAGRGNLLEQNRSIVQTTLQNTLVPKAKVETRYAKTLSKLLANLCHNTYQRGFLYNSGLWRGRLLLWAVWGWSQGSEVSEPKAPGFPVIIHGHQSLHSLHVTCTHSCRLEVTLDVWLELLNFHVGNLVWEQKN